MISDSLEPNDFWSFKLSQISFNSLISVSLPVQFSILSNNSFVIYLIPSTLNSNFSVNWNNKFVAKAEVYNTFPLNSPFSKGTAIYIEGIWTVYLW